MSTQRPSPQTLATFVLTLLLAAFPAFAAEPFLVGQGGATAVVFDDGPRIVLDLPAASHVSSSAAAGERFWVAGVASPAGGERHLLLREVSGEKVRSPAPPRVSQAAELREPQLLVDARGLRGLVWIEGKAPRRQEVRLAQRDAGGWRTSRLVSPVGPGSQMGLAVAALDAKTWVLAWSAFDGEDTEILWSRWTLGGEPSTPAVLGEGNAVPDILPSLLAVDGGVLAAWNRYVDGGYRTLVASFDGDAWSAPAEGERGSLYPSLHAGAAGPLLLYQTVVPQAWVVAEIGQGGAIGRSVRHRTANDERPRIRSVSGGGVELAWPEDAEAAKLNWR